ncbi:MAG: beta-eliminating lyase-related protein [Muribaculaceae bacterium]
MIKFNSDYMEGAHPLILKKLTEINLDKIDGYGVDDYCESAKNKIRKACNCPNADIYFLVGGTQTNALVIDALLSRCDGVLAADTGHINVHEAGAIEAFGHKVLTMPNINGKLSAIGVDEYIERFYADSSNTHMVAPGMVYISYPTEYGTLYSYQELRELHAVCKSHHIPLFIDGARLGYGLAATGNDVTLERIAECCDVFYIGGTKVGALFGEAIVVTNPEIIKQSMTLIKRHGALLAKGWLLGVQFDTLFTDNIYLEISKNAITMAEMLKSALIKKGYKFLIDSSTNQQFPIIDDAKIKELEAKVSFNIWERKDSTHTVVRFATSWATTPVQIEELIELL